MIHLIAKAWAHTSSQRLETSEGVDKMSKDKGRKEVKKPKQSKQAQ